MQRCTRRFLGRTSLVRTNRATFVANNEHWRWMFFDFFFVSRTTCGVVTASQRNRNTTVAPPPRTIPERVRNERLKLGNDYFQRFRRLLRKTCVDNTRGAYTRGDLHNTRPCRLFRRRTDVDVADSPSGIRCWRRRLSAPPLIQKNNYSIVEQTVHAERHGCARRTRKTRVQNGLCCSIRTETCKF